ncbi:uncharacterized protein LOC108138028 [Drosophila elegans]|uniref:uncharacterized protein LOC108138028 n=1 Tax=Drosophila elegans TaxID=30023 RepID=UPI0007E6F8F1|nr:uncharacterized protein LOC108138028 [Drosophila elegans]
MKMQAILLLFLLCAGCSTIAASGIFQSINLGGGGDSRSAGGNVDFNGNDWSDSVHNSDVDNLLKRLEKLDGSENNRNNWGNDDDRASGFDADRFRDDSNEDARGVQIISLA